MNRPLTLALGAALLVSSTAARAQEWAGCISSYELAQRLRQEGQLIEARDALIRCSQSTCPEAAQVDCARWFGEVEESIPTIVVVVRDERGKDAVDARASIDDHSIEVDGHALPLNPGLHVLRIARSGAVTREQRIIVIQGRKNQVIDVTLEAPEAKAPPASDAQPPPPSPLARAAAKTDAVVDRPVPALAYALGGVALAGAASFTTFGLIANGKERDLRATCAPVCDPDRVSSVRTLQIAADVSLGAGILAAAGAFWAYLARPSLVRTDVAIRPARGGASIFVGLRF